MDSKNKLHAHVRVTSCDNSELCETSLIKEAHARTNNILDANYEFLDIDSFVETLHYLSKENRESLRLLLHRYADLFDGKLGAWNAKPVNFELKENAKPYHARAYSIPKIHEETLRKEIARLIKLGVLEEDRDTEWAAPCFIIPKKMEQSDSLLTLEN